MAHFTPNSFQACHYKRPFIFRFSVIMNEEDISDRVSRLTGRQLVRELRIRGLDTTGDRPALLNRFNEYLKGRSSYME